MKKIYFILIFLIGSITVYAQNTSDSVRTAQAEMPQTADADALQQTTTHVTKAEADSAYIRNDFAAAVELYESILKNDGESSDIYYNLGNSYYKMNNIAKAVLNYERALLLNPGNGDIRFNLELARSKTVDKVTPPSEMFFVTWTQSLINTMSEKAWARTGIIAFILTILTLSLFIFGKRIIIKKVGFIAAICFFLITILANVFASEQKAELINHDNAIIMAPSVTVKSTPNQSGTDLFILHEGRKVMIKDNTMKEWKEIRLEDGNVGWVPTSVIEII
ncbi:MAG: tetratricopeptide repeat protein [Bacteroides sp.]|nr:tetratricopeptide repeat protein [Bacteroides sp.]